MHEVLFLDIATKTGWTQDDEHRPGSPQWGSELLEGEPEEYGRKMAQLETFLERRVAHRRPNYIGFEKPADPQFFNSGPSKGQIDGARATISAGDLANGLRLFDQLFDRPRRFTNFATIRLLIQLAGVAELVAHRNRIQCFEVPVQSWRSWFTGRQGGGKEPTFERCQQLGWNVSGFDEADSCGGWAFMKSKLDPKFALPVAGTPLFGPR